MAAPTISEAVAAAYRAAYGRFPLFLATMVPFALAASAIFVARKILLGPSRGWDAASLLLGFGLAPAALPFLAAGALAGGMGAGLGVVAAEAAIAGTPARPSDVWRRLLARLPTLLGTTVIALVAESLLVLAFVALVALGAPGPVLLLAGAADLAVGLGLALAWQLLLPVALLERRSVAGAFARSAALTRNRRGAILASGALALLPFLLVATVLVAAASRAAGIRPTGTLAASVLAWTVETPFVLAAAPLVPTLGVFWHRRLTEPNPANA